MAKDSHIITTTGGSPTSRAGSPTSRRRQRVSLDDFRHWVRDSRNELRKVTWPTWEQTRNLSLVVIAVCLVMGAFMGLVDTVLGYLVRLFIGG
jgi:preprotein translocase subunit SecE